MFSFRFPTTDWPGRQPVYQRTAFKLSRITEPFIRFLKLISCVFLFLYFNGLWPLFNKRLLTYLLTYFRSGSVRRTKQAVLQFSSVCYHYLTLLYHIVLSFHEPNPRLMQALRTIQKNAGNYELTQCLYMTYNWTHVLCGMLEPTITNSNISQHQQKEIKVKFYGTLDLLNLYKL